MGRRHRGRTVVAAGTVLLAAFVAWISIPQHQKRDVTLPPDDATPAQVVRVFLDAVDARDCDTREQLAPMLGSDDDDCRDVAGVDDISVRDPDPAPTPEDLDTYVSVGFDISWRWYHQTATLIGPTTWGYTLHRDDPDAPWRITAGGVG